MSLCVISLRNLVEVVDLETIKIRLWAFENTTRNCILVLFFSMSSLCMWN